MDTYFTLCNIFVKRFNACHLNFGIMLRATDYYERTVFKTDIFK